MLVGLGELRASSWLLCCAMAIGMAVSQGVPVAPLPLVGLP